MDKMTWSKPVAIAEQFMPNEYISACWGISCDYGEGAGDDGKPDPLTNNRNAYHRQMSNGTGCGWTHSQAVTDRTGQDGVFVVIEINSPTGGGDLPCTMYTDGTYRTPMANIRLSEISNGMTLYWANTWNGITWHHKGQVVMDDSHPNRS